MDHANPAAPTADDAAAAADVAARAATVEGRVEAAAGCERALQHIQAEVVDGLYEHLDLDPALRAPLVAAYDRTVRALEALLGPTVHVGRVDCELFEALHEVHESDVGSRPGFHTRASARAYLEPHRARTA